MKKELLNLVRRSIEQGYLPENWHQFNKHDVIKTATGFLALSADCIQIDDCYYQTLQDTEYFAFDEIDEENILYENCITVFRGREDYFYTKEEYRNNYYEYENCFYTCEGLDAYELVVTVSNIVALRDDVHYWESDRSYHFESEDDDYDDEDFEDNGEEDDVWEYHKGPCPPDYRDKPGEPGIGFEIEKGGYPVFCGFHNKEDLHEQTGCVIEKDSSVEWELKTPVYPLLSHKIEDLWLPQIQQAVNAEDHDCAGGHVHLSMPPKSGKQLFDYCRPYLPLFMAMYPKRLKTDYCKGKTEKSLKLDYEKHQAVNILHDRIELRFPAKVYDMRALVFRLNFCRLMIERKYANITTVTLSAFDTDTSLGKLVAQEYKGKEHTLLVRILDVAGNYFNTSLLKDKSIETLLTNLKKQKTCVLQS